MKERDCRNKGEIEKEIWRHLTGVYASRAAEGIEQQEEESLMEEIEDMVLNYWDELDLKGVEAISRRIYGRLRGELGPLSYLLKDRDITEIMVNGPRAVFVEKGGHLIKVDDNFGDVEDLELAIRRIAASVHREINELNPILDARLPDGSRVNAIMSNVAIGGPSLTIRRFSKEKITLEDMVLSGSLTEECAEDLKILVEGGFNIFVSGGTSSGKTTFLNALADYIPGEERVVVIEDSLELQLEDTENIVRLECRNANSIGKGRVSLNDLIRASLRMRPDRIVVGEVRGSEAADMLQSLNTGHSGLSTGHGNSAAGMLRRMEAMYLSGVDIPMDAIRAQITEGIDIMVHLMRGPDGKRRVVEVEELIGFKDDRYILNPLYKIDENRRLSWTGNKLKDGTKLRLRGLEGDRL